MKKYFRIYQTLLHLNLSSLVAYRVNFTTNLISSISWGVFSIFSVLLLTSKTDMVYGWKREEIILLTTTYSVLIGIFHTMFSKNFERFSRMILYGRLDSVLLKPIDSQFMISLWIINYTSLSRVILGLGLTFYFLHQLHIALSPVIVVSYVLLLVMSLILLYSIWFIVATLTIWFPRLSNVVEFMYHVSGMTRYPQQMYRQLTNFIFIFLLPITLIISTPTKVLLGKNIVQDVIGLIIFTIALFIFSRMFWKFALRYYTSASS
jgi:ABC-2 type transport system permease protein